MRDTPLKYFTLIYALIFLPACQPAIESKQYVIIENTTAIDAINGERHNVDILISGNKIVSVTPSPVDLKLRDSVDRIDGRDKFVIPGLWDAHVHLSYDEKIGHEVFFPLSIAHGVTYLRDTGGHLDKLEKARAISKSDSTQPDLYVSGPLLDGKKRIYDGSSPGFPDLSVGLVTEKEARDYVDALAEQGVSFVKAYEMLPPNIFSAISNQASKHDLPMAMHIPLSMTAEEAIAAGADDMQHLRNIELSCASNYQALAKARADRIGTQTDIAPNKIRSQLHNEQRALALPNQSEQKCSSLIKLLAEENVYQTPTLTISRFFTRRLFEDESFITTYDYMPQEVTEAWRRRSSRLKDIAPNEAGLAYDEWIVQTLPKMAKADVPIIAGTDAPIAFLTPGASLHEELIMLVESGLTPLRALRAATYEPARFFGLEDKQGVISSNMKADLVILESNPLNDIAHIKDISAVIKDGFLFEREALDQKLLEP